MANEVMNVSSGKPKVTGAIYRAPLADNLTIPTDESTALAAAFKCLGYISDDGVSNDSSITTEQIRAWGGDVVLVTQTEKNDTFKFKLLEVLNEDVLKTVYVDSNVVVTPQSGDTPKKITVSVNSKEQPDCCFVIDMILRGDKIKRIVIPNGKLTEIDEIVYKDDEAIGYNITITAQVDDAGNSHYEYLTA